ncbi:class I SAM-dependent methyltransferase [Bacillus bingmayongensis]|uniref:class I SAM-dependent methyltransferase n=1 Tax=Bacillus bingmayongensis TaxID=1150157 RepID=UPI000314DAD4|nr:class I SAM-dependent methyltransferase [Bacillus bingmayongensis]MBY0600187.1 class I SAM-dependent methyltransferase [Bacillus bingmayongensis]
MSVLQKLIEQAKNPRGSIGSSMLCIMNTVHARLTNWALQKVNIPKDSVILDIGCGSGRTIHTLSKINTYGTIYGIDYSEKAVENSIKSNRSDVKNGKVMIHRASVSSIPFDDNFFDLITAFQTHYFWPNLEHDIKEVFRVLKPNGSFMIVAEIFKINYHMQKFKITEELVTLFTKTGFQHIKYYEEKGCLCIVGSKS